MYIEEDVEKQCVWTGVRLFQGLLKNASTIITTKGFLQSDLLYKTKLIPLSSPMGYS